MLLLLLLLMMMITAVFAMYCFGLVIFVDILFAVACSRTCNY